MTLTFESLDEIIRCDHSNESSLLALSHSAICFSTLYKMKFAILLEICLWLHLAVKGLISISCGIHCGLQQTANVNLYHVTKYIHL